MIVSVAGAALAAALPLALAAGLVPELLVAPPQAARTIVATRPSVAMVRCISFPLLSDAHVGDRVRAPLDETIFEPGQSDLRRERDDGEDEHRGEDPVGVE